MKDFNFQLFGVLRGSTLGFDGSPLWYLKFYSNLSGHGVNKAYLVKLSSRRLKVKGSKQLKTSKRSF